MPQRPLGLADVGQRGQAVVVEPAMLFYMEQRLDALRQRQDWRWSALAGGLCMCKVSAHPAFLAFHAVFLESSTVTFVAASGRSPGRLLLALPQVWAARWPYRRSALGPLVAINFRPAGGHRIGLIDNLWRLTQVSFWECGRGMQRCLARSGGR
eukprot:213854-Amphidinium_carterae.1